MTPPDTERGIPSDGAGSATRGPEGDDLARLRRLVARMPGVLYAYSTAGGGTYYSPGVKNLLGVDADHLRANPYFWRDSIHPEDRPAVHAAVAGALAGLPFAIDYRIRRADGAWRWLRDRSISIERDADVTVIEGLATDVTEERIAAQAREEALARLEKIAAHVPGLVYQYQEWPDGRRAFPFASGGIFDIYGLTPGDVRSDASPLLDIIHPEDLPQVLQSIERSRETLCWWRSQYRVRLPDGRRLSLDGEATPERLPDGSTLWHGYIRDVTESHRAEEHLRKLSQAVEQSPETVLITDLTAKIEYVNATFVERTGYSRNEALGSNPRFLRSGRTSAATYEEMWRALTAGRPWSGELVNRRKDGSEFIEYARITPLRAGDGSVTHFVAVMEDITERKRVAAELAEYHERLEQLVEERTRDLARARDEAQSANRENRAFLANMSHEIRTPLNSIMGFSDLILSEISGPINEEQKRQLEIVTSASRHLLALINDVLDISKIEAGQLAVDCAPFNIVATLKSAAATLQPAVDRRGLQLIVDIAPDVSQARGDERRVLQVLMNLLSNAVKFTSQGVVELTAERAGDEVVVHVRDTGLGIDDEDQARLFSPFRQARNPPPGQSHEGVGLGLAISRRLVELQGGRIWMRSAPGAGSTFSFTLPVV